MADNEQPVAKKRGRPRTKPDYESDPNVQARNRAGERSNNRKPKTVAEDALPEEAPAAEAVATEETPAEESTGGVVGEAQKEVDAVAEMPEEKTEETPAVETPAEEAKEPASEEAAETPAAEAAETPKGEEPTAIEQFAAEEAKEPEHQGSEAIQEFAKEEAQEPQHQKPMHEEVGEYMPPEGAAHDELIDQYHDALAFGDMETAKALYKQLQNHRFMENTHRAKSEAQAAKDAQDYLDTADELAAKYPQLAEDGMESDKVLALMDVYRANGARAADALRSAVNDLYKEMPAPAASAMPEETPLMPEAPAEEAVPAPEPEVPPPAEESVTETPPAPEPTPEPEPVVPDMSERQAQKRKIVNMPSAAARNEPPPAEKPPSRSDAIDFMKKARGQK